jgi:hypothetical protein
LATLSTGRQHDLAQVLHHICSTVANHRPVVEVIMTDQKPPPAAPTRFQLIVATVLLGLFVVFLVVLFLVRSDQHWDRMMFLLSGFEAVVFAGAGMTFGTSVQRANVQAAQQDANTQRSRAEQAEQDANAGRQLKAAIEHRADMRQATAPPGPGDRPTEGAGGGGSSAAADMAELAAMARALFREG